MKSPKEMSTEELLGKANLDFPLFVCDVDNLVIDTGTMAPQGVARVEGDTALQAEARLYLIIRAVNSFEAMRETLRDLAHASDACFMDLKQFGTIQKSNGFAYRKARANALDLSEGKESEPKPISPA